MRRALLLAAILALPALARADDTQAVLAGGGLRFTKSAAIAMEREDLSLSPAEVRVAFVFRNRGAEPITTDVAFPLPELDVGDFSEIPHTFHYSGRDGDLVDFHLSVDGKPVVATLDARAFNEKGVDITRVLQSLRIPLVGARSDDEIDKAFHALKPAGVKRLLAAGGGYSDEWTGQDTARHPRWIVRAVYHWRQTFPAGTPVRIEHRYRPILGEIQFDKFADLLPDNALGALGAWPDEHRAWCATPALIAAAGDSEARARVRWLEYILKTGANWAGPIGAFHLEIIPPPGATALTCPISGLTLRHAGHTILADRANFTPTSDLAVLFLSTPR